MVNVKYVGIATAALLAFAFAVGLGTGYLVWGYKSSAPGPAPATWRISQRTVGGTALPLNQYERRNAELEKALKQRDAELIAAVQADVVAPAATTTHEATTIEGRPDTLTWSWLERGGGDGVADFGQRDVTMNWKPWRFDVDVELTREKDGRVGATVSTTEPGLEIAQTRFFMDDPWKKKWYEKFEAGVAAGWGDGFTYQGHAGYDGWNIYVQRDRAGESFMTGKTFGFF